MLIVRSQELKMYHRIVRSQIVNIFAALGRNDLCRLALNRVLPHFVWFIRR